MMNSTTWKRFPTDVVDRLFKAVDEDDIINNSTELPEKVILECSQENIHDYYSLCLQLWEEGFTREELLSLIKLLLSGQQLSAEQRKQYKYIRARYKHLRFAQRLYSANHDANFLFKVTTVFLGHLQDAFKNNDKQRIRYFGYALCLLLSKTIWSMVHRSLRSIKLDNPDGFHRYTHRQVDTLKKMLAKPLVTGTEFHDTRKIISQQVSFFDTQRSIEVDNQHAYDISRFLSNINGLMGDKHDVMVAEKLAKLRDYEKPSELDATIRLALEQLVARIE